jgi:hypothetical protein
VPRATDNTALRRSLARDWPTSTRGPTRGTYSRPGADDQLIAPGAGLRADMDAAGLGRHPSCSQTSRRHVLNGPLLPEAPGVQVHGYVC